jgi:peptidyl-prolyl cis-trans isomerase SurA
MKLRSLFVAVALLVSASSFSQTLFTYGKKSVGASEFLKAFNKNNTTAGNNKVKAINEYLTQYIKSKLRMAEAYERRYDTLTHIKMEVGNLRSQIAENYMSDPELINRMTKEAFDRSLKDVRFSHIFISFTNAAGAMDTLSATTKKNDLLKRLAKGEDFGTLAQQFSDDAASKATKGDAGFITVFTLPYEFENAIYNTAVGKYSSAIRSKSGFHIFKKTEERKAVGKIKAQQILLAIQPGSDEASRKAIAAKADSLYKELVKGAAFSQLAVTFSNDYISAANSGIMSEIGVGQYDGAFEKALWALSKDGAISKPFQTAHGWHILKRISLKPVVTIATDKANQQELQQKVMADGRWRASKDFIYAKIASSGRYKKLAYSDGGLRAFADNQLDLKPMNGIEFSSTTKLFTIGDTSYDATSLINYGKSFRYKNDGTGVKTLDQLMDEWTKNAMYTYYKAHLEDFNEEFNGQMKEFMDGNLFFEIMQQEVWNKAQADSVALASLYNNNKKNYQWKQSADAVIFFCSDSVTARQLFTAIKTNPLDWKNAVAQYPETVIADSSRYEWEQLPNLNKSIPRPGMITTPLVNRNDNTVSFAYIIATYPQPMQRSYTEAKGLVINDYQAVLEKKWDDALSKKYPAVVNKKVLAAISK